jgi:hypothetical protein
MSKYAYIVRGSEDGVIAVASSMNKAVNIARNYIHHCGEYMDDEYFVKNYFYRVSGSSLEAEVERFFFE